MTVSMFDDGAAIAALVKKARDDVRRSREARYRERIAKLFDEIALWRARETTARLTLRTIARGVSDRVAAVDAANKAHEMVRALEREVAWATEHHFDRRRVWARLDECVPALNLECERVSQ